jgi:hypothetical protein
MIDINFNKDPYPNAEMLPYERECLYDWVINIIKPKNILETGTGIGGSTYFMGMALKALGYGKIYTCDPGRKPTDDFFAEFKNVNFYSINSLEMIKNIKQNKINIDFIFFDGPEDSAIAMQDILELEDYVSPGCYFSMHDWEITQRGFDNAISSKALLIRPYIEKSNKWKLIKQLSGLKKNSMANDYAYDSVGLCLYQFTG